MPVQCQASVAPVREAVLRFLARSARKQLSVREVAAAVPCSPQYIYRLFPNRAWRRKPNNATRLQAYLAAHPEAVATRVRGGKTFIEIAAELSIASDTVRRLWRELQLPDRRTFKLSQQEKNHRAYERRKERHREEVRDWYRRHLERGREINQAARRRWLAKVVREERCIVCGVRFAWTNAKEDRRRRRGQRVVCSLRCGTQAGADERRASAAARMSAKSATSTRAAP